jgi:hypothetical protein
MKVRIAYIDAEQSQFWQQLDMPAACTVQDAIDASGVLEQFPEIDLEQQKIGIFGKFAKPEDTLNDGDRVEIYRPITADPATVKRRER